MDALIIDQQRFYESPLFGSGRWLFAEMHDGTLSEVLERMKYLGVRRVQLGRTGHLVSIEEVQAQRATA